MGRLLEIARNAGEVAREALTENTVVTKGDSPDSFRAERIRLSDFATAGQMLRIWSDVLGQEVVFASDNADPAKLPPGLPVYRARELAALWGEDGPPSPEHLRRIHDAKTAFEGEVVDGETGLTNDPTES